MNYTYLTTGSERTINLGHIQIILIHGAPRNFSYETRLIALLVQALKAIGKENVGEEELQTIRSLVAQEPAREPLIKDVNVMPAWMKRLVKPMLEQKKAYEKVMDK